MIKIVFSVKKDGHYSTFITHYMQSYCHTSKMENLGTSYQLTPSKLSRINSHLCLQHSAAGAAFSDSYVFEYFHLGLYHNFTWITTVCIHKSSSVSLHYDNLTPGVEIFDNFYFCLSYRYHYDASPVVTDGGLETRCQISTVNALDPCLYMPKAPAF